MHDTKFGPTSDRQDSSPAARGVIISFVAVASTAVAHCLAVSYVPTHGAVLFGLAVLVPLCIVLSFAPRTRRRLIGEILTVQMFLHGIFSLSAGTQGAGQLQTLLTNTDCSALLAHGGALLVTYGAIRRADELVELLYTLLNLSGRGAPEHAVNIFPVCVPLIEDVWTPTETRPSNGPISLRGPPTPVG